MFSHDFVNATSFKDRTHERNHQFHVRQAHFVTHKLHGTAFHSEALCELVGNVAASATEAQHRIFFIWFVLSATDQLTVFVALEVRKTHDHFLRIESSGNRCHAFSNLTFVEFLRRSVTGGETFCGVTQFTWHIRVVEHHLRVDADIVVDDEFQTSEAHTLVRDSLEFKSELRIAHVHHDLHGDFRQRATLDFFHSHFQEAFVDVTRVAFSAGNRHARAFGQAFRCVTATHHSRNAQFASNNSGVASTTTAVRHDGRGLLHHWFPVGVGHVRDEHVACLHTIHFSGAFHHTHRALANLLTNSATLAKEVALALQRIAQLHVHALLLGLHGFRTSLQDVDLAINTVFTPFDVHRAAVVLFNNASKLRQFDHIIVSNREATTIFVSHFQGAYRTTRGAIGFKLHLDQLATQVLTNDRVLASVQNGLMHIEFVRVHSPLHHRFTQAIASRNEDHLVKARFRIQREHHASSTLVGAAHTLHASRESYFRVGEALVNTVRNSTVVIERGKHFFHASEHGINADHVQHSFLLTSKRGIGQVFSRCGRAHSHGDFSLTVFEPFVEITNFFFQFGRERCRFNPTTDFSTGLSQGFHVINVKRFKALGNTFFKTTFFNEKTEGFGGGCKTIWHTNARRSQLAEQLAQGSILAADTIDVIHAKLTKRENVTTY